MSPNNIFTLRHTNMLKGVALLLLLCNHFCVVKAWITPQYLIDIEIHGKPLLGYVGAFGKICVALWAFLSGIGAYYSCNKGIAQVYKSNLVRLANLLIQYGLILAVVFVPVIAWCKPLFCGEAYDLSVKHLIWNLLACDAEYDKAAWYMRFYIMYVLTFPLLVAAKRRVKNNSLFYAVTFLVFLFVPKTFPLWIAEGTMLGTYPLNQMLGEYCSYILIVVTGYMAAEYDLFGRAQRLTASKRGIVCAVVMLVCAMALRSYTKSIHLGIVDIYTDIVITPFVIYAFYVFFEHTAERVRGAFVYLGKASMVVWLIHWIFNVGVPEIQAVAYFPKVSYLVVLWVLVMCLVFQRVFSWFIGRSHLLLSVKR